MVSDLSTLIHNLVLDNPMPAKDLAKAIGKPYSTLLREVNPYDAGAKLGAETLVEIMEHTGDVKPLEFIAERLGFRLMPLKAQWEVPHVTPGAFQGAASGTHIPEAASPTSGTAMAHEAKAAPESADVTTRA